MIKPSQLFSYVFATFLLSSPIFCLAQSSFQQETLTPQMLAQKKPPYEKFEDVTVHFSVFNSTQIQADIAKLHDLKRASNTVLINIAVIDNKSPQSGGKPAKLKGFAANLMQQRRALEFKEIRENDIVYYLASLRFNNEEIIHFTIEVEPLIENSTKTHTVKFTKTLYTND
ncbi:hypothetical protein NBRC116493_00590 [Aurantivibrio infirmus]